jgi:hypothetical protein
LKRDNVVSVGRSIGEHTIDLRAEVIIKDNSELLELLEAVKAMDGVRDVVWSEVVDIMGAKRSVPSSIIDQLGGSKDAIIRTNIAGWAECLSGVLKDRIYGLGWAFSMVSGPHPGFCLSILPNLTAWF